MSGLVWAAGPARPALGEETVHVWRADLERVDDRLLRSLSEQERARAAAFPRPGAGKLWAHSRALLRDLLGRYLGAAPPALGLEPDKTGRLTLAGPQPISFNLSHSGPLALYAFASRAPVGVDVEVGARPVNERALARRLMGSAGETRLSGLTPEERRRELLREWVRREALLKCAGPGERTVIEARRGACRRRRGRGRVEHGALCELLAYALDGGALRDEHERSTHGQIHARLDECALEVEDSLEDSINPAGKHQVGHRVVDALRKALTPAGECH